MAKHSVNNCCANIESQESLPSFQKFLMILMTLFILSFGVFTVGVGAVECNADLSQGGGYFL